MLPVTERVKINGIKLTSELVLLHLPQQENVSPSPFFLLLNCLSENKINLPFVSTIDLWGRSGLSCCILSHHFQQVKKLLTPIGSIDKNIEYIHHVGAVSIFPHQSHMQILGTLLRVIGENNLSIYGLASSVSSLIFITDYINLEKAAAYLKTCFDLPDDYEPMRES